MKKRSALLAGFLNLVSPGLGFLYVGKPVYAVGLPISLVLTIAVASWSKLIFRPEGLLALVAINLTLWLGSIVVVSIIARRQGEVTLKRYQRWYVYLGFLVASSLVGNLLTETRGQLFGYETYRMPSGAMMPTLLVGDFILVDTAAYRSAPPSRGDVIVFRYPENPDIPFVKRVVGVPGDELRYGPTSLHINGEAVAGKYISTYTGIGSGAPYSGAGLYEERLGGVTHRILLQPRFASPAGKAVVDAEQWFVLGDNRSNSRDSRYWGTVPGSHLIGKVVMVWMNYDSGHGIDSPRIGMAVR